MDRQTREGVDGTGRSNKINMKCDTCKYLRSDSGSSNPELGSPHPHAWCAKGNWEGYEPGPADNDHWSLCTEYMPTFRHWIDEVKNILTEKLWIIDDDLADYMEDYYKLNFTPDAAVTSEFKI